MKPWLCVIGLALSLGCATAIVRPYVGDQQSWPTASGGIVNVKYDLPIFTSLPPVPYEVLAEMRIGSPFYANPEEGHMPRITRAAKEIGADALVFVQGKIFFSTNYGPRSGADSDAGVQKAPTLTTVNTFNPESFAPEVTILAIRWIGDAPPGLPSHQKKAAPVATKPSEATLATTTTESAAPQPPPPATSEKKEEQKPAEAPSSVEQPKPEEPKAESSSPAPSATQPANPSGQ
jgi:hypothetical protein